MYISVTQRHKRNMASDGRNQPPWTPPQPGPSVQLPRLKVYNSLTRQNDDFVPGDPLGKLVAWYGPTVYEDAHLGHAKNYVSNGYHPAHHARLFRLQRQVCDEHDEY